MEKKIIVLSIVLFAGFIVSCGDDASASATSTATASEYTNYSNFKSGYQPLPESTSTSFALNSKFYIELQESAVPYTWNYTTDNAFTVYVDESTFAVNADAAGAPVQKIWRFTCGTAGQTVLTFKKTSISNSSNVIDTKVFTVIAK